MRLRPLVAELRRRTLPTLRQQLHLVDFARSLLGGRAAVVLSVIVAGFATGRLRVGPGRPLGEGRDLPPGGAVLLLQPLQQFFQPLQQRLDVRRELGDLSLEVGIMRLELRHALR